ALAEIRIGKAVAAAHLLTLHALRDPAVAVIGGAVAVAILAPHAAVVVAHHQVLFGAPFIVAHLPGHPDLLASGVWMPQRRCDASDGCGVLSDSGPAGRCHTSPGGAAACRIRLTPAGQVANRRRMLVGRMVE